MYQKCFISAYLTEHAVVRYHPLSVCVSDVGFARVHQNQNQKDHVR